MNGTTRELLWCAPDVDVNPNAIRSGIPLLFPFPNRIKRGRFTWKGKEYQLPINDPQQQNAIHGFVFNRPWQLNRELNGLTTGIEAVFDSRQHPDLDGLWPSSFLCRAYYRIDDVSLLLQFEVTNTGEVELPFGFGVHPYWAIDAARARIRLSDSGNPVQIKAWELVNLLPNGMFRSLTPSEEKLLDGRPLESDEVDAVFHVPPSRFNSLRWEMWQGDEEGRLSGETWQTFVVFTPPHRQAVCIEPYTCPTDAINLHHAGLRVPFDSLMPGVTWCTTVEWCYYPWFRYPK